MKIQTAAYKQEYYLAASGIKCTTFQEDITPHKVYRLLYILVGGGNTEIKIIEDMEDKMSREKDQECIDNISDDYSFVKKKLQEVIDNGGGGGNS